MIKIKCGTCGTSQGYKSSADGALSLPASEEARLVERGVADYVTTPIIGEDPDEPTTPPPGNGEPDGGKQDTLDDNPPEDAATRGEGADAEVARLERMQKVDLEQMAADMGVDISGARTKHDIAVLIVAAGETDDGETPPDLGAGDIVE